MMDKQHKKLLPCAADHRLDDAAKLSLGVVASPQCPLPFRKIIEAPRRPAVSQSPVCLSLARQAKIKCSASP